MHQTSDTKSSAIGSLMTLAAGFSVRLKLAMVVALGMATTFAVSFTLVVLNEQQIASDFQTENQVLVADLLSAQMEAPLRFKDGGRIAEIYRTAIQKDPAILVIDVTHVSGEQLARHLSDDDALVPVADALVQNAISVASESGKKVETNQGDIFVTALPVLTSDGVNTVGYLAVAWNHGLTKAALLKKVLVAVAVSAVVALAGLLAIFYLIARMVTKPISALNVAMQSVSETDYSIDIPGLSRRDEIGLMAARLAHFRDTLAHEDEQRALRNAEAENRQKLFQRLAVGLSDLAAGRIDCPIDSSEFSGLDQHHIGICENFNEVIANLREMLSTVTTTAELVRKSSLEISEVSADQSKRSESQAATLEESAAAIESLNSSVQQTAAHAADANEQILVNKNKAEAGGEVVALTVNAMKNIEESSQQITAIIGVIDDIAFQTNLLALNAGVEAARAGEAGRGFAVVASEVRALAQRASDSANEIKELILRSSEQVNEGSELANKAGAALNDIIDGVKRVSDLVSLIATGSREQANNLAEIKESVGELDQVTQQNAAIIEESSAASQSLSDEAERVSAALQCFKIEADAPRDPEEAWREELGTPPQSPPKPPATQALPFATSRAGNAALAADDQDEWHEF